MKEVTCLCGWQCRGTEDEVVEHALRHLSWLLHDDPAVRTALAAWAPDLDAYVPEPFRNL